MTAAPDRPDRVNDVPGLEPIAAGDLGGTGVAAAQGLAFGQELGSGGAMNGAVDAAAAEQRGVGGIDDGVDVERRDVGDADLEPRRSDIGGEQGRRTLMPGIVALSGDEVQIGRWNANQLSRTSAASSCRGFVMSATQISSRDPPISKAACWAKMVVRSDPPWYFCAR